MRGCHWLGGCKHEEQPWCWCPRSSRQICVTITTSTPRPTGSTLGCWLVCPCSTPKGCAASTTWVRQSRCAEPPASGPAWSSGALPPVSASTPWSNCSDRVGPTRWARAAIPRRPWSCWRSTPIPGPSSVSGGLGSLPCWCAPVVVCGVRTRPTSSWPWPPRPSPCGPEVASISPTWPRTSPPRSGSCAI